MTRSRKRVKTITTKSKFRFSKTELYYSKVTDKTYSYDGKQQGWFSFYTIDGGFGYYTESDVEELQLELSK